MIDPRCNHCGRELDTPGALIFSPPVPHQTLVVKYHVCSLCWGTFLALLQNPLKPKEVGS